MTSGPWRPALRVLQLDASRLDRLLVDMLLRQLVAASEPLGWAVPEHRQADLATGLGAVLYALTVARSGATYGQRLLNLRYARHGQVPSRAAMWAHFSCVVLVPWLWQKAHRVLTETHDEVSETNASHGLRSRRNKLRTAVTSTLAGHWSQHHCGRPCARSQMHTFTHALTYVHTHARTHTWHRRRLSEDQSLPGAWTR